MYSITENIYCSQLSSVAILLQPEPNCFTSYNTRKGLCSLSLSLCVLSSCRLPLPPTCLLATANEARSYFASIIDSALLSRDESSKHLEWRLCVSAVSNLNKTSGMHVSCINTYYIFIFYIYFLTIYHCFAFKNYTGSCKFPFRSLLH
jgi:hypothetical protein